MKLLDAKQPNMRREQLVSAAKKLFDKKGVEKTRIQDIVEHIGVAKGVFYYYFASKDEMVQEIALQIGTNVQAYTAAVLENNSYDFCQKLAAFLDLYINVADQFWPDDESIKAGEDEKIIFLPGPSLVLGQLRVLLWQGIQNKDISIEYPEQTALLMLLGLKPYVYTHTPSREIIFTLAAQVLGLPPQSIRIYAKEANPVPPFIPEAKSTNY